MGFVRLIVLVMLKIVVATRYRIRERGLDQLAAVRGKTTLVLPNHPAYTDPAVVMSRVYRSLKPRPMVWTGMARNPLLFWLKPVLQPVEVPDLEESSKAARDQADAAVQLVVEGLQAGSSHIIWPSGRLQRDGRDVLGANRGVGLILDACPDAEVLLVRTEGLWGSRFSWARTGEMPNLAIELLRAAWLILANLVLFMPRRRVTLTYRHVDRDDLRAQANDAAARALDDTDGGADGADAGSDEVANAARQLARVRSVNRVLEQFFNDVESPDPQYARYHFLLGARTFAFPARGLAQPEGLARITGKTKEQVRELLEELLGRPVTDAAYTSEQTLDNLGFDSLDRMEVGLTIEERAGVHNGESKPPTTVAECWALAQGELEADSPPVAPAAWHQPVRDAGYPEILADTIAEAFVRRCFVDPKRIILADDISGALPYERVLLGAYLMAKRLRKIDAPNVGLMLPASVGADLGFYALQMAGKLPAALNWTTGQQNLEHACKVMGLTHIVTSKRFVDRLHLEVPGITIVFLEDLRASIGTAEKIAALIAVRYRRAAILRRLPKQDANAPAVVLFTSGSEKAPKAVPLTHRNLLSNVASIVEAIGPTQDDSFIGFLPVFHSFGITVTVLFTVLGGVRVVHHPDPTDALALAQKIADYKPTFLVATPTFLGFILDRAAPGGLDSLRIAVVGAEACPQRIFDRFAAAVPRATIIEGYGVSECSPVISANRPHDSRPGSIGKPVPGVDVIVVDPDTLKPVPDGTRGMLLAAGPNVFPGYLGYDDPQPFHQHDGRTWYVTGDLVRVDEDGYLHFEGRLKRFIKVAGEMVSLPAIEAPFAEDYPADEDGPRVAVEAVETDEGGKHTVLFTRGIALTLQQANKRLEAAGMRGVFRLDEVQSVDEIAVLGTGKTDYKPLRARVEAAVAATSTA